MAELSTMAMLSALHISIYSARKFDKKETKALAERHGTNEKVARVSKRLYESKNYNDILKAVSAARQEYYENTLPWMDDGGRITTSANFMSLTSVMRQKEAEFYRPVPLFISEWPEIVQAARFTLNGLWDAKDYPPAYKLKDRFKFELKFYPLPDANDFRAAIRDEDIDAIRKQITLDNKSSLQKAMDEPYRRLFDGVAHMASRLNGAKTCPCRACKGREFKTDEFKDSLIDNLVSMVEVLPRLNLTNDPVLTDLIDEVKTSLTPFNPGVIRENEPLRKTLAARAAEIQSNMAGFFSQVA